MVELFWDIFPISTVSAIDWDKRAWRVATQRLARERAPWKGAGTRDRVVSEASLEPALENADAHRLAIKIEEILLVRQAGTIAPSEPHDSLDDSWIVSGGPDVGSELAVLGDQRCLFAFELLDSFDQAA